MLTESENGSINKIQELPYSSKFNLQKFLVNFKNSFLYNIIFGLLNIFLSLLCIILYIFMTYNPHQFLIHNFYFIIIFICEILFLFDFILDLTFMIIEKKFNIIALIIDGITIFPFFICRIIYGFTFNLISSGDLICFSFISFRIIRMKKFSNFLKSEVNRELVNITTSILSLLIICTIELNVVENTQTVGNYFLFLERDCFDSKSCTGQNDSFHTTFFFIMTLLSTIGYYSNAMSLLGTVLIVILIIIQVSILPSIITDLMNQITSKTMYARKSYKKIEHVDFILLSGNINLGCIDVLLQEYFHVDHGQNEKHALILNNQTPDAEMKRLLNKYNNKLFFLEGDCLKLNDLERCMFRHAKMIMLLCNKQTDDPYTEDSKTIMQAMTIKKFLIKNNKNNLNIENRLLIQLVRPESEHHFELSNNNNNNNYNNKDQIVCIDELKLSLLSKSCLCKGIITLISNLITTNRSLDEKNIMLNHILEENNWMKYYLEGMEFEIYKISLDNKRGFSFNEIAEKIFDLYNVILIGINIENINSKENIVLLNPDFIFPDDKSIIIYGYIIAKDITEANKIMIDFSKISLKKNNNNINNDEDEINIKINKKNSLINTNKFLNDKIILSHYYHIVNEPILKENAIYQTLQNKLIIKKGHIIICGICQNLIDFIKPLRAKYIKKIDCPSIVILSKELPDDRIWNSMSLFDEIFLIQGDPMNKKDLIRAGIQTAGKVIILSPSINEIESYTNKRKKNEIARKLSKEEEDLLDAKTIFKYNLISQIQKGIFVVIELINPKNISFLNNKNRKNMDEYIFIKAGMDISLTSSFASGEVYYSNMMDNLMSQIYYNPNLLTVVKKLIAGDNELKINKNDIKDYLEIPSGNLFLINMPLNLNENIEKIFDENEDDNNFLTFGNVYKYLLKNNMVCMGIYKHDNIYEESFYYVVTSPPKNFKLNEKDKLFVISLVFPDKINSIDINNNNVNSIEFNNEKKINQNKNKKNVFKDLNKTIDIEGENKIRKLYETINNMKLMVKNVRNNILNLNVKIKNNIEESINSTISEIYNKNKLPELNV